MKDYSTISKLYFLLVNADGQFNEKEIILGKKMTIIEELDYNLFQKEMDKLKDLDKEVIFNDAVKGLARLSKSQQINFIAWMSLIANSDGFMDKTEWDLIYKIYKKNLDLNLDDIMARQRELNLLVQSKLHAV